MALLSSRFRSPRIFRNQISAFGFGMENGSGGAVTQATSATTGVTLSRRSGQITTVVENIAAEASVKFTVTNTTVGANDVVMVTLASGSNGGNTAVNVVAVAEGSFDIRISNNNASAGTAETGTLVINFVVIRSAIQ